jgi:hypothetical protein
MLYTLQYTTPWWTPEGELRCREWLATRTFEAAIMRAMTEGAGMPDDWEERHDAMMRDVQEEFKRDLDNGGPRLHPRDRREERMMKGMLARQWSSAEHEAQMQQIEAAHAVVLAGLRKEHARRLWKKAACAAWMVAEFRASVERSAAPGGAAAKRAGAHFDSCAKLQCV